MKKIIVLLFIFLLLTGFVFAHGGEVEEEKTALNLTNPVLYVAFSFLWLVIFTAYLIIKRKEFVVDEELGEKKNNRKAKKIVFLLMTAPVILSTLYLGGHTVYENFTSISGGPVHWHADYQVWACDKKLELINPEGITNRIGSAVLHEHDDDRIHIEGTVTDWRDITLGQYFKVIGGELSNGHLAYPAEDGTVNYKSGDLCNNGLGVLKVYVNGKRVSDYENYLVYPDSYVPPGDCIIVKFDSDESNETDILCDTWTVEGWNYGNFVRREVKIGDKIWQ